jgi:SAM-dependent methyltransferase
MSEAAGADPREGPTLPNETPDPRPAIYRDLHRNQLRRQEEANRHSARVVLAELFRRFVPRSVLDVGCGLGTWLEVARGLGVGNVLGIEGEWLDRDLARLPPEQILALDLEHPFDLGRRFDLVVCLEVAEHLPERAAESFVASLVRHADVVLFSAAIPFQGGRHHVNEQFPEYWARLFARHGCRPLDFLRPALWHDSSVLWYLRQNSLVFAREELATGAGPFAGLALPAAPPALVHPDLYLMKLEHARSVAREHDKLLAVLRPGGRFSVVRQPNGQLTIAAEPAAPGPLPAAPAARAARSWPEAAATPAAGRSGPRLATVCLAVSDAASEAWRRCLEVVLAHSPRDAFALRFAGREAPESLAYLLGRLTPDGLAPEYALLPGQVERFWWDGPGPAVAVWHAPPGCDDDTLARLPCCDLAPEGDFLLWLRPDDALGASWWEAVRPLLQPGIDCIGRPAWADLGPEQVEWVRAQPWYRGVPFAMAKGRPRVRHPGGPVVGLRTACWREVDFPPPAPPHGPNPWAEPGGADILLGAMAQQLGWTFAGCEVPARPPEEE